MPYFAITMRRKESPPQWLWFPQLKADLHTKSRLLFKITMFCAQNSSYPYPNGMWHCACFIWHTKAIGHHSCQQTFLVKISRSQSTIPEIEEETKNFMVTCYSSKPCHSMTECHQWMWWVKSGKIVLSAQKLCTLPPTTEVFHVNISRAHLQLSHWNAAL